MWWPIAAMVALALVNAPNGVSAVTDLILD
jgi:hypothetical protein